MNAIYLVLILKKFLREKTMTKNFFKYKSGVITTITPAKAQIEMIDYTFFLPCKNEGKF